MWIVLQEDINYPIKEGYQGRKMSFYRYLEAIYCQYMDYAAAYNNRHSIEEVIERIYAKYKSKLWKDANEIDYHIIKSLN